MSLAEEEEAETQQLMQDASEEEPKISQLAISPVTSNKMSSGAASNTSKTPGHLFTSGSNSINDHSKVSYINERRTHRDPLGRSNYNNRPRNLHKEVPDVKHMEKALLELLDDFHTGKLSAFGTGCSMEEMMNIRDQQEHLARLHFRLCADAEKPTDDTDLSYSTSNARDNMSQLVQSLEQLSASIEHLHSGDVSGASAASK